MSNRCERPWSWSVWLEFVGTMIAAAIVCFVLGWLTAGCVVPVPPTPPPQPPPANPWTVGFVVQDPDGSAVADATVTVEGSAGPQRTNADGYVAFLVPHRLASGAVLVVKDGYVAAQSSDVWATVDYQNVSVVLTPDRPLHFDPSTVPLEQLARIRGALFTARGALSQGPRPGQPTNVISTERAWDWWTENDWQIVLHEYRDVRHLTHIAIGPLAGDDCYHGVYRPCTQDLSEANRDRFLDFVQRLWDSGLAPVYRHKPDNWERPEHAADLDRLDALMSTERAQRLLRIVTYAGWEPNGDRYGWTNRTYVDMVSRGARVFPNALRTLHTTCDVEVPVGATDKPDPLDRREDPALVTVDPGFGNAWRNVLPFIHLWEQQICGYVEGGYELPTLTFLSELRWVVVNQPPRTKPGGRWYGGQTAWGPNTPLRWVLSEYGSYAHFWYDWPERGAVQIGDFAIQNGSDGYFDGGTLPVGDGPVPWGKP